MTGCAVAYFRTSSQTNVGGDSDRRRREAAQEYAKRAGLRIGAECYDAAMSGADPINERKGFTDLLSWARENDCRTILVESASRFARDLIVQETGYEMLAREGFTLMAVDDPDAFTADAPTARMIRQIPGAVAGFEKANLVAKLKGARDRKSAELGRRIEGRLGYRNSTPENTKLVAEAKRPARRNPKTGERRSLREIAAELAALGFTTAAGRPFSASQVQRLIGR